MSQYIHKTGQGLSYSSNCARQNLSFIVQTNHRTTENLTKKVITSPLDIVDMQENRKDEDYIIKKIHVRAINVTIKHMTKSLQIFADMETSTNFTQDDYTITKNNDK